jgi:hypothetical protein
LLESLFANMKAVIALVVVAALFAVALAEDDFRPVNTTGSTCGGNCPSAGCPSCKCGTSTNYVNVASYCEKYTDWTQSCCKCIANAESGGNANAENYNTNGSYDIGVWQINDVNWSSCSGGSPPCNPTTNVECAHLVWTWGGKTWKYWSTCGKCGCCSSA